MIRIYHTSDLHDRAASSLRCGRSARSSRDCSSIAGDALRGSQTAYRREEPIDCGNGCGRLRRAGDRKSRVPLPFLVAARARVARMHHPLVCTNLQDTKSRALPFLPVLRLQPRDGAARHAGVHVCGLLIMQYPLGSLWERIFGWRFLQPWDAIAPYARPSRRAIARRALAHWSLARPRACRRVCRESILILGGHSHDTLERPGIRGRSADRPRRTIRALRFTQRAASTSRDVAGMR